jgi:hypothetical protein
MELVKAGTELVLFLLIGIPVFHTVGEWWNKQFDNWRIGRERRERGEEES